MTGVITKILKAEPFVGEDGIEYIKLTKEIHTPRKTYLKGEIAGKYRGDKMLFEGGRPNMDLFDFEIYEASVVCNSRENFRKNSPFRVKGKIEFPRERLPRDIPVTILANNTSYDANILEPALFDFESPRKYRQVHGDEAYGNFTAHITGYIFDYEKSVIEEIVEFYEPANEPVQTISPVEDIVISGGIKKSGYEKLNRYDKKGNAVESWIYRPNIVRQSTLAGCANFFFGTVATILGLLFLIILIPNFIYLILFGGLIYLIFSFERIFKWIFRIAAAFFLLLFGYSLFNAAHVAHGASTSARVQDSRETGVVPVRPVEEPRDTRDVSDVTDVHEQHHVHEIRDEYIKRFRSWKDYDGNLFEGYYTVRCSDFDESHQFKNGYHLNAVDRYSYDKLVHDLKEHDKNGLDGLYRMLDSIRENNRLGRTEFAEMAVSMVQDIPYSLVLEQACSKSYYSDPFIRQWLSKSDADCDPNQRFGINAPIEFITNLKGDCDTRTLLLYTILDHYKYDVALLSSEFYQHSILAINLPLDGQAYYYQNNRYVLWETTSAGIRAGIISPKMANMDHWRISLKSKSQ